MKVDEARIKAMDEGSAKTIAEMELNFEKEMQTIDRQKEDALRKKIEDARTAWDANPENKGKSFDGSGITLSKDENTPFNELYKGGIAAFEKNLKEYQDKQDDAWNEYYIKYGEYQEKRKAIMDKYDKQIADAEEGSVEKSTFIAQRKEDLDSLDDELMKDSELWSKFFTDFSNRSSSSIRSIIEDIQELVDYMNGVEGAKIPDLFKDNEKTVKAINDAMSDPSSLNKFTSNLSSQVNKFKKMLDKDNPFKQIQEGFKNNDFESTSKGFSGIASAVRELDGVLGDLGVKSDSTAGKVTSVLSSTASYAATGASVGGPWGAVIGGAIGMASAIASRSAIICSANAFWEAFNSADSLTVRSKTPSPSLSDFAAQSLYKASILARYLFATRFSKMAFFKYSPKSSAISLLLLFISERVETKLS